MKNSKKAVVVSCVILLSGVGCGQENSTRAEADALLTRISRLNPNAPEREREQQLTELKALAVQAPELRTLRDTCHAAHAGLLQAERMQGEVRSALDAIERERSADKPPEPNALSALETTMREAGAALTRARASQERCENDARELTLHRR